MPVGGLGALNGETFVDSRAPVSSLMERLVFPAWLRSALRYFALPVLIVLLWQLLSNLKLIQPLLLPPPSQVAASGWELLKDGTLPRHIGYSLLRVLEGFGAASLIAVPFGIAVGLSRSFEHMTDFMVQVTKPIPPIAWIPLAILWFGIGEVSKVYIIMLGAFFPVLVNTVDGIRQTEGRFVEVAKVLEVSRWRFICQVVIPGALPSIMTGLRLGLGMAWVCVVAAELIAAEKGVGYMIMDARQLSQSDVVILGMIAIGLIGKVMDSILRVLEKCLITWRENFSGT